MKKIPACEQVGFIERAKNPKALCRLQMMGGEFCGNALRALACWFTYKSGKRVNNFLVESSGIEKLITISANLKARIAQVTIPFTDSYRAVNWSLLINDGLVPAELVKVPGISFFVVSEKFDNSRINPRSVFTSLYKEKNFKPAACGIVFYKALAMEKFAIKPIVYVDKTQTITRETSCASGSVALVISLGLRRAKILQPSGYMLSIELSKKGIIVAGSYIEFKGRILDCR